MAHIKSYFWEFLIFHVIFVRVFSSQSSDYQKEAKTLGLKLNRSFLTMMTTTMMMMNYFCDMVDRRKAFSFISSGDHGQISSPSRISDTQQGEFEPAQKLSSGLGNWSCAVVITTTQRNHCDIVTTTKTRRCGSDSCDYCDQTC